MSGISSYISLYWNTSIDTCHSLMEINAHREHEIIFCRAEKEFDGETCNIDIPKIKKAYIDKSGNLLKFSDAAINEVNDMCRYNICREIYMDEDTERIKVREFPDVKHLYEYKVNIIEALCEFHELYGIITGWTGIEDLINEELNIDNFIAQLSEEQIRKLFIVTRTYGRKHLVKDLFTCGKNLEEEEKFYYAVEANYINCIVTGKMTI